MELDEGEGLKAHYYAIILSFPFIHHFHCNVIVIDISILKTSLKICIHNQIVSLKISGLLVIQSQR